jgi:gas vesicle protein
MSTCFQYADKSEEELSGMKTELKQIKQSLQAISDAYKPVAKQSQKSFSETVLSKDNTVDTSKTR